MIYSLGWWWFMMVAASLELSSTSQRPRPRAQQRHVPPQRHYLTMTVLVEESVGAVGVSQIHANATVVNTFHFVSFILIDLQSPNSNILRWNNCKVFHLLRLVVTFLQSSYQFWSERFTFDDRSQGPQPIEPEQCDISTESWTILISNTRLKSLSFINFLLVNRFWDLYAVHSLSTYAVEHVNQSLWRRWQSICEPHKWW